MSIEIRLEGNALELKEQARGFLKELAGQEPEQVELPDTDVVKRGDPLVMAGVILMIPPAIVATLDLVERAKCSEAVKALLDKVRGQEGTVMLIATESQPLDLTTATPDEVMDLLDKCLGQ